MTSFKLFMMTDVIDYEDLSNRNGISMTASMNLDINKIAYPTIRKPDRRYILNLFLTE
jgi:hypothetical protein